MSRFDLNRMDLKERLVMLNRCAKVVKGGRRFSYAAVMVVGDGQGHVGVGMGKARETPEAIRKGIEQAKKNLFEVPLTGRTIPHVVREAFGAADVLLKPAAPGTGVIAGGAVRAVVEAAGIQDVLSKSLGSSNKVNVVKATEKALKALTTPDVVSRRRGVAVGPSKGESEQTSSALEQVQQEAPGHIEGVVPTAMEAGHQGHVGNTPAPAGGAK
ncbi:MAG: 30S ribosomal protein S5 [Chloroflexi bacterium]|nr:30S ribosomal protein S5 [Chloroflexota bacterium]